MLKSLYTNNLARNAIKMLAIRIDSVDFKWEMPPVTCTSLSIKNG